ncbi:hypothetical protein [Ramlibacter albus]|uniref:Uncharacterized protein n=1 Tax=Ramlibacter albus TaxID=2079448 RepID=A0A923S3X1_9BURK|nr:hypothetical protein [Ramlibacter albus]MBC5766895.1 hypothetical protein [Ramlibacter albus]
MLLFKLGLVALSVMLSTLAARRFGHRVGGALAGMPMIAAPIMAILLIDQGVAQVRAIALATLACLPATILHIVTFAKAAARFTWPVCLALALGGFLVAGVALAAVQMPPWAVCLVAVASPAAGLWHAAHHSGPPARAGVPRIEFGLRIAAAVGMAAAIILGADAFPPAVSGLLLAVPITGTVLPCFTLPRYGAAATASLMTGFLQGLHGFAAFFVALYWGLAAMHPAAAFCVALAAALGVALAMQAGVRLAQRPPA